MSIKKKVSLLKSLLYLLAVIKNGNMTATAEQNGIKISNLSRIIKDLETLTGFKLLNRKSNGVTPTEAGRQLVGLVSVIEDDLRKLEKIGLKNSEKNEEIILKIPENFVINNINEFEQEYPNLRIEIVSEDENYDIGIFYNEPRLKEGFNITEYALDNKFLIQKIWIAYCKNKQSVCLLYDFIFCQLRL